VSPQKILDADVTQIEFLFVEVRIVPPLHRQDFVDHILVEAVFHEPCGVPRDDGKWRDVLRDHGSRPDDRSVADGYTTQDRCATRDPDIVSDSRGLFRLLDILARLYQPE